MSALKRALPRPLPVSRPGPGELRIGMAVFDRHYDMPAEISGFAGPMVLLTRPTGLRWQVRHISLRPATPYEKRQLLALARLHRTRLKGL
ncbi:hypothetical protein ACFWAA_09950 [Streptomyces sp. NPDC059922]|uniref:hypothetical protein n=1 Tax=Streptomyces sp. NPDC059922 TaxID=3347005 RepID=UPI00364BD6D7